MICRARDSRITIHHPEDFGIDSDNLPEWDRSHRPGYTLLGWGWYEDLRHTSIEMTKFKCSILVRDEVWHIITKYAYNADADGYSDIEYLSEFLERLFGTK